MDTFLVIRFEPVFGKTEFFNSYSLYHSQFSTCRFFLLSDFLDSKSSLT
jgi:hypothetical protein